MSNDMIEHGDKVNVHFERSSSLFGVTVLRAASATGDCWVFEKDNHELTDRELFYVQTFAYMERKGE